MPSRRTRVFLVAAVAVLAVVAPLGAATTMHGQMDDSTADASSASAPEEPLEDGGTYWIGQTLADDRWNVDAVELQHREDGDWVFVSDLPVTDDRVRVHTTDADPGRYRLVADGTARTVAFRLRAQTLDVSLNASTIKDHGSATTTRASIRSNRAGYDLAVTSPDLNASTLQRALGRGDAVDTDDDGVTDAVVLEDVSSDAEVTADFRCMGGGNRTLAFTPLDASAAANASVTVEAPAIPDVSFTEAVLRPSNDGVVRIPVGVERCADRATVVVGSEDEPVSLVATVDDSDDDGRAVMLWNTSATQTVDAALAAGNGTTLVDATRERPDGDVGNESPGGDYALSLHGGNGTDAPEVDVATALTGANEDSPDVEIDSVDAPTELTTGDEFAVAVTVGNAAGSEVSTTVRLVRDDERVSSESLDVAAGATEVVTFSLTAPDDVGEVRYSVVAGDANATLAVDVLDGSGPDATTTATTVTADSTVTTTATTGTGVGETDGTATGGAADANGMPGFDFVGALVAVIGVALLARRRR